MRRQFLPMLMLMLLCSVIVFAQNRTITGKVTNEKGEPVPFSSVVIKGSVKGISTDSEGNFKLEAKRGDILVVSATGLLPKEFTVGDENVIDVTLTVQRSNLSEVVVTALGIKRQPKELGYSTTKIGSQELTQAKVTNIATGLAAKVSGLQINLVNNGVKPDVRITLRGNRSLLGNNQALLVIDDNILPVNYLNSLNPNDVDNVIVLKGASAAALYGSAATNGVIIITTRRGSKGKPVIRVSSTATVEEISYMPKFQNRFGPNGGENNPNQYPGIVGFPENPFNWYVPYENQNFGPEYNGAKVPVGGPVRIFRPDGSYFDSTLMGYNSAKPNAKKDFFDRGLTWQHDISYSTGDEKSRFFLSLQDVDVKGIVPKDVSHRNTFRINGMRETGKLRADYNLGYTITRSNTTPGSGVPFRWGTTDFSGGYTGGGSYWQNRPVYWTVINTPANIDLRDYRDWKNNPFATPDGYFNAYYGNPWWQIDQTRLDERSADFIGNASITFKATDWLNVLYRASYARTDYENKYTKAGYVFADWAIADPLGAGNIPSSLLQLNPGMGDGFSTNQRFTGDLLISLQRNFLKDLDVKLILGNQVQNSYFRAASLSAGALVIPGLFNISNRIGEPNVSEAKVQSRTYGIFGDLMLGWKEFLFLHGSIRNDWTSVLSKDNRSYLYPSADASFVFTELPGITLPSWLSYGKLRAALSSTAQVSIGSYSTQNLFTTGAGFPYSNASGYTLDNTYANADIKPEITKEVEAGFEIGLFDNKVSFSAAYYRATTSDQTIPITISSATGFSRAYVNSGEMLNKGVELDIKATAFSAKDFVWDIGANFSYNKSRILSIGHGLQEVFIGGNSYAVVGEAYPVIKTTDWKRDDEGRIIVSKANGLPSIDPVQKYFGTANPPYRIGLNTTLRYKEFQLNVLADGRFGAVIFNSIGSSLDFTGVSWYSAQSGRQAFVLPNSVVEDGTGKYVPNTSYTVNDGNTQFWASTWNAVGSNYVTSADFWKLREVSLIYNLPAKFLKKVKGVIQSVSVGLVGRNLATWKASQNVWTDPEFSNTNGNGVGTTDINQTPPTRFYGANITMTF